MGFVDRGGGREGKGTSLRRSKKNPGCGASRNLSARTDTAPVLSTEEQLKRRRCAVPPPAIAKNELLHQFLLAGGDTTDLFFEDPHEVITAAVAAAAARQPGVPAPSLAAEAVAAVGHVDSAAALLCRMLEDTPLPVLLSRAAEEADLSTIITWSPDYAKQAALLTLCDSLTPASDILTSAANAAAPAKRVHFKEEEDEDDKKPSEAAVQVKVVANASNPSDEKPPSIPYAVVGLYPDDADSHSGQQQRWESLVSGPLSTQRSVVGIFSGLNPQHRGLPSQRHSMDEALRIATLARLPLVLHFPAARASAAANGVEETGRRLVEWLDEHHLLDIDADQQSKDGDATEGEQQQSKWKRWPPAIVLHNAASIILATPQLMDWMLRSGRQQQEGWEGAPHLYLSVSAASAADVVSLLPRPPSTIKAAAGKDVEEIHEGRLVLGAHQLLISSDSPWHTPKLLANEPDIRNEPANYMDVVRLLARSLIAREDEEKRLRQDGEETAAVRRARLEEREAIVMEWLARCAALNGVALWFAQYFTQRYLSPELVRRQQEQQQQLEEEEIRKKKVLSGASIMTNSTGGEERSLCCRACQQPLVDARVVLHHDAPRGRRQRRRQQQQDDEGECNEDCDGVEAIGGDGDCKVLPVPLWLPVDVMKSMQSSGGGAQLPSALLSRLKGATLLNCGAGGLWMAGGGKVSCRHCRAAVGRVRRSDGADAGGEHKTGRRDDDDDDDDDGSSSMLRKGGKKGRNKASKRHADPSAYPSTDDANNRGNVGGERVEVCIQCSEVLRPAECPLSDPSSMALAAMVWLDRASTISSVQVEKQRRRKLEEEQIRSGDDGDEACEDVEATASSAFSPCSEEPDTELAKLLAAAAQERRQLEEEAHGAEVVRQDTIRQRKEREAEERMGKLKKNVKASNRANFTEFRNKAFSKSGGGKHHNNNNNNSAAAVDANDDESDE